MYRHTIHIHLRTQSQCNQHLYTIAHLHTYTNLNTERPARRSLSQGLDLVDRVSALLEDTVVRVHVIVRAIEQTQVLHHHLYKVYCKEWVNCGAV